MYWNKVESVRVATPSGASSAPTVKTALPSKVVVSENPPASKLFCLDSNSSTRLLTFARPSLISLTKVLLFNLEVDFSLRT